jgi:putative ABC transport system permease protein
LARRYFPNADAIGKRLRRGDAKSKSPWRTIVGIVGDTKGIAYGNLGWRTEAMMYEPLRQATDNGLARGLSLFIRLGEKAPLTAAMFRAELRAVDPNLPAPELTPMETFIARQLRQPRLQTLLAGSLAVLALVLAALGLYGVMSYAVIQRTPEIGLRMALGAGRRDVLRLVLGQGLKLFGLGALLGLAGALGLTRWLASLLYGISATDPFTFVGITLLLMLVALLACWRPARRATKVDPLLALRHE